MAMLDLFFARKKDQSPPVASGGYVHDDLPKALRVQIVQILCDGMGSYGEGGNSKAWDLVRGLLAREMGVHDLGYASQNARDDVLRFIEEDARLDHVFGAIEACSFWIHIAGRLLSDAQRRSRGIKADPDEVFEELNGRLERTGIGYRIEGYQIFRVDSATVHKEIVVRALDLCSDPRFADANECYHSAHIHYRSGNHKDAVLNAVDAFRNALKTICDVNGLSYTQEASAAELMNVLRSTAFLPDSIDPSFAQLTLASDISLSEIKLEQMISREAAYVLHLAAAKIVYLVGLQHDRDSALRVH